MLDKKITLMMLTASKILLYTITKCLTTAGKRPMIDVAALREAYRKKEIFGIILFCTDFNSTDAFKNK